MRNVLPIAVALGLSACASTDTSVQKSSLSAAVKTCTDQQARFVDAWGCFQAKSLLGTLGVPEAQLAEFTKFGDNLASQVTARRMSNVTAKKSLIEKAANTG